ncbi:MAG TPA: DUF6228 family protein [Pyrinomonadaceae bacterium]|nr:DUF6228 family protein [Pyrinomonadaceae bacterium]
MQIVGQANNASIELSEPDGLKNSAGSEYYRVTLRENEFEASVRVYAFDPTDNGLPKFFGELAASWNGWDGKRTWSSLEGEFELSCEHDRVGHVATTATIHSNRHGHGWIGQIRFDMAAGELQGIASGVARFFSR